MKQIMMCPNCGKKFKENGKLFCSEFCEVIYLDETKPIELKKHKDVSKGVF